MKYFSMFSGIGGFENGIERAFQLNWVSDGESLLPDWDQSDNSDSLRRRPHPVCVGFSELDKYATSIYKKHFGGDCGNKKSGESLQRAERRSIQPEWDKPDLESRSYEQQESWGNRELQQPKDIIRTQRKGGHKEYGDCTKIQWSEVEDFDCLVGGFPCQAFSIAGKRGGFSDTRGTLFFEIARCLKEKQPRLCVLENVKGLLSHDKGNTFFTILTTLDELGYDCEWQVLNSKSFGVPQNRERVFIIGHLRGSGGRKVFPVGGENKKALRYNQCDLSGKGYKSQDSRVYNLDNIIGTLVNIMTKPRIRRLTPTECERLQGFPDGWTEGISDTQRYKCLGNAVTTNVITAIFKELL